MSLLERGSSFLPETVSSKEKRNSLSFVGSIRYISRISLAVLALNYGVAPRQYNNEPSSAPHSYAERIVTSLFGSAREAEAGPLSGRSIPIKGQIIFLSKGTQIREGPGFRFKSTIPAKWGGGAPEDNWAVKVIGDKELCVDNWIWVDTSRKLAGDPSGGTGWAALFTPCEELSPPPTRPPTPPSATPTPRPPEPTPIPSASPHDTRPEKGKIFLLKRGTQIREGPGFGYKSTIPLERGSGVPEDNWAVMVQNIANSPKCADTWMWWDVSRKLAGDPSGGTGWAAINSPCETAKPPDTPTITPVHTTQPTVIPLPTALPTSTSAPVTETGPTVSTKPQPVPTPDKTPKPAETKPVERAPQPVKDQIFKLSKGTQIRVGPGLKYASTIPAKYGSSVPEDNWAVKVIGDKNSPVCADGWWWWNVDRGAVVAGNGTGWAAITRCEPDINQVKEILHPPGSLTTGSNIDNKYQSVSFLGPVTLAERIAEPSVYGTTGTVANFAGGFIHTSRLGTYETHGDIARAYLSYGGSKSWLGFPTSDEYIDPQTRHPRSNFEGGYITWRDNPINPERRGYYIAFDLQGCPDHDCIQPQDKTFHDISEALTGMEWSIDTLSDEHASIIDKGLATGNIVLTFLPGGIIVKSAKAGKSVLVPAEKLTQAASKELPEIAQRLISTLKQVHQERAIEYLGKPAVEYWEGARELLYHFERHAKEFWQGITHEEYTAIGKEIIADTTSEIYERMYRGDTRLTIYNAEQNIVVFTDKAKRIIYSIFKPNKEYLERQGIR